MRKHEARRWRASSVIRGRCLVRARTAAIRISDERGREREQSDRKHDERAVE
jgi:hypothetical protein